MIAVDTNVLVRCLTLDDPTQVPAARALLGHGNGVFVAKTVLLELEWVLRAAYKLPRTTIHLALERLLGLPNLSAEDPDQLRQALDGYSGGLDFADALHLATCKACRCRDRSRFQRSLGERRASPARRLVTLRRAAPLKTQTFLQRRPEFEPPPLRQFISASVRRLRPARRARCTAPAPRRPSTV